jgi:hypothetical protein
VLSVPKTIAATAVHVPSQPAAAKNERHERQKKKKKNHFHSVQDWKMSDTTERPQWTYNLVIVLGALLMSLSAIQGMGGKKDADKKGKGKPEIPAGFRTFQASYVAVYLIIMLSDWLQGTHMWSLYNEYKEDPNNDLPEDAISTLFITGRRRTCFAYLLFCSTLAAIRFQVLPLREYVPRSLAPLSTGGGARKHVWCIASSNL